MIFIKFFVFLADKSKVRVYLFTAGFLLVALLHAEISMAAASTRYPVELPLKVQDQDTHKALLLPAKKGYSYEVSEQLTDIAVLRVFNSEGRALDGYYEITIEELHQLLNQKIGEGLNATNPAVAPQKCATCQLGDANKPELIPDRRPALERPIPVPLK